VKRQVAVIVANTPANLAAKKATDSIPVVFTTASDPIQIGLVDNISRPGGNVTGISQLNASLAPKRLELAHELMPNATDIALLVNPNDPARAEKISAEVQQAANHLGLHLHILRAGTERDIEKTVADFSGLKASVLVVGADAFFNANSRLLAEATLRHAVPTIYEYTEFTDAGGLMSYGRILPLGRHLCGADSEGRKTRRSAGAAVHHRRTDREPENREGPWRYRPAVVARPRRQDHRVKRRGC
jgi:putative ABC transport system substrate-binding protein